MTLKPVNGMAVVQFSQPNRGVVSPEFPINAAIESPHTFELQSGNVPAPGVRVEFHDTTILPGRFKIQFGGRFFDVMEQRIIVDGQEYNWTPPVRLSGK